MIFALADLFESIADAVGEREAVVCGNRRLDYRSLDERATRLAHALRDAGVGAGDHVALYLFNGTEYLEAALAAYKIRAVPINVNYRYVEEELRYLFDDADVVAVVHHAELSPRLDRIAPDLAKLALAIHVDDGSGLACRDLRSIDYETALADASTERSFPARSPDDLYILYTGGTTGMPKGVMWRQEDVFFAALGGGNPMGQPIEQPEELAANARAKSMQMTMFPVAPLMHGAAQWASFMALFGGDRLVLYDGKHFDAHRIWELVERESVQSIAIVGDAMARPLAEALASGNRRYDTSSLVVVGSGGAILSPAVREELTRRLGDVLILDSFGVSETGFQGRGSQARAEGAPRFHVDETTVVLDEALRPVEPGSGAVGRLARRGRVPLGYYKDAAKSARTFVTVDGTRYALPGDMASVESDGSITLLGRGSVCINSGGEKVFPEEVEAVLKAHPAVFDVLVVGVSDARWGQRVAAIVAPRTGADVSLEDLQRHCRDRIAGYKVPKSVRVVDAIVRHPSGKPDYRWARQVAES